MFSGQCFLLYEKRLSVRERNMKLLLETVTYIAIKESHLHNLGFSIVCVWGGAWGGGSPILKFFSNPPPPSKPMPPIGHPPLKNKSHPSEKHPPPPPPIETCSTLP